MKNTRLIVASILIVPMIAVACDNDDGSAGTDDGAEGTTPTVSATGAAAAGNVEGQMNTVLDCLHGAGITNAFPTNVLHSETRRITLDPPYTLIYLYDDPAKIDDDLPELEEASDGGLVEFGNVVVSYQDKPGAAAETIEDCVNP